MMKMTGENSIPIFVFVISTLAVLVSSATASFNLDSLFVKSVGGETAVKRLETLSTLHASGKISLFGQQGTFEIYETMPDKLYLGVDLGSYTIVQAYDGSVAWQQDFNGAVAELSGFERKTLISQLYFQSYSYLFDDRLPGSAEYLGLTEHDGTTCHKVAFYPLNEDTTTILFDTATGLQRYSLDFMDNLETVTSFEDYRTVDNIEVSFFSSSSLEGIPVTSDFTIEKIEFDVDIDPGLYVRPDAELTDWRFPDNADSVVVPFEYEAGHIYVPVVINGKNKLRLILDSGSSANIFHAPALADLDLEIVGTSQAKGVGGFDEVNLVKTDSINIGGLVLLSQVAGAVDLSGIGITNNEDEPFGGLLGYDFLSRFPVMIDYANKTLTIYRPENFHTPEGGHPVDFTYTMQIPTVKAQLLGIPGDFIIDLGNSFGLMLHKEFAETNDFEHKLDNVQDISGMLGGVGGQVEAKSGYAASFRLGDLEFSSLRLLIIESSYGLSGSTSVAGNIGNLMLEQFRVLFDYPDQQIVFYDTTMESQ